MSMLQPSERAVWLESPPATVEENLAIDEAVLEEAHEGLRPRTTVRIWSSPEPVVVVGSSSRLELEVDQRACERLGVRIVRRPSGGATVVLGPGCLVWSAVEPRAVASDGVEAMHRRFLQPICGALERRGVEARRMGTSDLAVAGRKFSGNALRVRRHAVLYHGTFLDRFDLGLVESLLPHPPREPDYRASRSHGAFLMNLELGAPVIEEVLREAFSADTSDDRPPIDRMRRLLACRYHDPTWTRRL